VIMEELIRIAAVCLIGALLTVFLKKDSPEIGLMLALAVCAVVLIAMTRSIGEILDVLYQMIAWSGVGTEVFEPLVKIVGIALVCRVSSELCRDAGQGAMASLLEMGGAFGAIWIAVPLFRAVWEVLRSMI